VVAAEVYDTTIRAEKMFCARVKYLLFSSSCKMYYFVFVSREKNWHDILGYDSIIFAVFISFSPA
jgi:hypothetical protein